MCTRGSRPLPAFPKGPKCSIFRKFMGYLGYVGYMGPVRVLLVGYAVRSALGASRPEVLDQLVAVVFPTDHGRRHRASRQVRLEYATAVVASEPFGVRFLDYPCMDQSVQLFHLFAHEREVSHVSVILL